MATRELRIRSIMAFAARHPDADLSLAALSRRASCSPFHLHRLFGATAHETVKQFTLRLRLDRAAVNLAGSRESILRIALACGFRSHETFTRAFLQRFGMTPRAYRRRGLGPTATATTIATHVAAAAHISPCLGLFHTPTPYVSRRSDMAYTITTSELMPQPVLVVRRRVRRSDIAATLAEQLGRIFQHIQRSGGAIAGQPFTRYLDWGPGMLTLEVGLPVASPVAGEPGGGAQGILSAVLPGGLAALTTHTGTYEQLNEAHAAVQVWIEDNGLKVTGAPWETYVTDPAEVPDPAQWQTQIVWPVQG